MSRENDFILYISLVSKFYEKAIFNHSRKSELAKLLMSFKQEIHTAELAPKVSNQDDEDIKTVKTFYMNDTKSRSSSPSHQLQLRKNEKYLADFNIFSFKQQNIFWRILAYSYIMGLINKSDSVTIQKLKQQTALQTQKQLNSPGQKLLKKFSLIFDYIGRVIASNSFTNEVKIRLQTIFSEEKPLLSNFLKLLLKKRKSSLLIDQIPNESSIEEICSILDIELIVYQITEDLIKKKYGSGECTIIISQDKLSGTYFSLESKSVEGRQDKNKSLKIKKSAIMKSLIESFQKNQIVISEKKNAKNGQNKDQIIKTRLKNMLNK